MSCLSNDTEIHYFLKKKNNLTVKLILQPPKPAEEEKMQLFPLSAAQLIFYKSRAKQTKREDLASKLTSLLNDRFILDICLYSNEFFENILL